MDIKSFRKEAHDFKTKFLEEVRSWEPKVYGIVSENHGIERLERLEYSIPVIGRIAWIEYEQTDSVGDPIEYYYFMNALVCKIDTDNHTIERF